jgi:UDP-glucose 4,6-dehydratase
LNIVWFNFITKYNFSRFCWFLSNGENQYPEKLIPKFIKLLKEEKALTIQGDGTCVRGFLHVKDVAAAFSLLLKKGEIGQIYNIGCDIKDEYSVMSVAHMLIEFIHETKEYEKHITFIEDRPFNDKRYFIKSEKLKNLGWEITVPFSEGLKNLCSFQ